MVRDSGFGMCPGPHLYAHDWPGHASRMRIRLRVTIWRGDELQLRASAPWAPRTRNAVSDIDILRHIEVRDLAGEPVDHL